VADHVHIGIALSQSAASFSARAARACSAPTPLPNRVRQRFIRKIEAAVLEDIDLDPAKELDAAQFPADPLDFARLLAQPLGVKTVSNRQTPRMIGDRQILESCFGSFARHLFDGRTPVGVVGMGMQVPTKVAAFEKDGQAARSCGFDFSAILAQLRRDP